jgi:hypothetical protein
MRRMTLVFFMATFVAVTAAAQQRDPASALQLVGNGEIAAYLVSGNARERITGRVSFHLATSGEEALVQGFNVVFFGVDQKLLAGDAKLDDPLGMLGFAVSQEKPQSLRYDPTSGRISGTLRMYGDASFLAQFARPVGDGKNDAFETPTLPVTTSVTIDLGIDPDQARKEPLTVAGNVQIGLKIGSTPAVRVLPFEVQLIEKQFVKIDIAPLFFIEVARKLCVQPVRLLRFSFGRFGFPFLQLTGEGLAFGQPGANTQWAKADVVFEYRDWKTIGGSSFFTLSESETSALRGKVEDDDCIEVFFVRDFNPADLFGGGATFGSGTASAQIISTDANARGGIDLTHLAHELGHVLGLRHPGAAPTASAVPASTGTLLCPSGFLNDNPRVNSQQNKDLLSNPLLRFALKLRTVGPDCTDSADCGACP